MNSEKVNAAISIVDDELDLVPRHENEDETPSEIRVHNVTQSNVLNVLDRGLSDHKRRIAAAPISEEPLSEETLTGRDSGEETVSNREKEADFVQTEAEWKNLIFLTDFTYVVTLMRFQNESLVEAKMSISYGEMNL